MKFQLKRFENMHPSNPFAPAVFSQSPFDARAKTICEHLKKRKMFRRNAPVCPSLSFHLFLTIARGRLKNNKNPRQQNDVTSRIKTYSAANGQNVFGNSCYVTFARSLSSTLSLFFSSRAFTKTQRTRIFSYFLSTHAAAEQLSRFASALAQE